MRSYVAFIHKDPEGDYTAVFPDFPGCLAVGGTLDEALDLAREVLPSHIETLREVGAVIPAPMALEAALQTDPMHRKALAFPVGVPSEAPLV